MVSKKIIILMFVLFSLLFCDIVYAETDSVDFEVDRDCLEEKLDRTHQLRIGSENDVISYSEFSVHEQEIIAKDCLRRLAEENNNVAYCDLIDNSELMDGCYRNLDITHYPTFFKRVLFILLIITAIVLGVGFILPNKSYPYLLYIFSSLAILSELLYVSQKGFDIFFMSAYRLISYNIVLSFFVFSPIITLLIALIFKHRIFSVSRKKSLLSMGLYALIIAIVVFCFFLMLLLTILPET